MTATPFRAGQVGLPDEVLRDLIPLDGRPRDNSRGARLYAWRKRWWVVLFQTGLGEVVVEHWGPLGTADEEES